MEVQVPGRPTGRLTRLPALPALACTAVLALAAGCGEDTGKRPKDTDPALTPAAAKQLARKQAKKTGGHVVQLSGVGSEPKPTGGSGDAPSPGAQSDAEVRAELKQARATLRDFRGHLDSAFLVTGPRARILGDGTAQAPDDAPDVVKRVILAANEIAKFPYKWGGGHGAWRDSGYDCSGSVSFALAGAGLLDRPLASGGFIDYGDEGPGKWITIYTNPGHMFMVVAGLRFDTSGRGRAGTRWQQAPRTVRGFVVRHPPRF